MNIGVLCVATGRYVCFWDEFYKSAKEFLFKNHNVHFFVYSDASEINYEDNDDVTKLFAQSSKWPISVCDKFAILLSRKKFYKDFDYLFHFNINMKFIAPIGDEILPDKDNGYLCACEWINHKLKGVVDNFPYERNSRSLAYIPYGEGSHYFMSGAFGGRTKEYIEMCSEIEDNIRRDFQDGIIAIWHDESHFNKYMLNKNPLIMPSGYIIPENWKIKSCKNNRRGLLLNKKHWKYGGQSYLRGISDKKITPFKYWVSKLFNVKV
ncbi:TPA: hypothetical protein IAA86_01035 [Candidatus Galligastranaerophilus intestinavium]|uniref:Glycosyltransferase family 6 n=1 Tax=Candidatus Galligastranaerophilus intestinavium TaxID=2840836 RepID=A0A9D1FGT1_9BACT|nr:hypothetical protein [Candidatus Galligastranaerophilus intestinavium]